MTAHSSMHTKSWLSLNDVTQPALKDVPNPRPSKGCHRQDIYPKLPLQPVILQATLEDTYTFRTSDWNWEKS